jgi:hypothetical protein
MKLLIALAAWLVATALLVAAPAARADDGGGFQIKIGGLALVSGSGKPRTEARAVTGFQAIATRGSIKLLLRQGSREGVELSGDDNILPLIETQVVDHGGVPTLEIGARRGTSMSPRLPLVASVDLITLKAISIAGGGTVTSEALKTSTLKLSIAGSATVKLHQLSADEVATQVSGSGDIEFTGRVTKLAVSISGSGDVNTRGLEADDVSVNVAGSGDASVTARKTLNVSIAGSGNVVYAGDATVKSSIAGHGSVKKQ